MSSHECPVFLGVDVAQLTLAIQFSDDLWSTGNTAEGHAASVLRKYGAKLRFTARPGSRRSHPELAELVRSASARPSLP